MDTKIHSDAVQDMQAQGFTTLSCKDMSQTIAIASRGFAALLADPAARAAFTIPSDAYPKDELGEPYELGILEEKCGEYKDVARLGFFDQAAGRVVDDVRKDRFHYAPKLLQLLPREVRLEHGGFLASLALLNTLAVEAVCQLTREFEKMKWSFRRSYPLSLSSRLQYAFPITRIIRYGENNSALPDAQVHRDRDYLTVHHFSSVAGLSLFDNQNKAYTIPETDPRSVSVFTGEKFWALTRGVFGTGVPHGVFDLRRKHGAPRNSHRFVVVTFVHLPLDPADVAWLLEHKADIKLSGADYQL